MLWQRSTPVSLLYRSRRVIAADGSTVVNIYYTSTYDITFVIDPNKGTTTGATTPKVRYGATPTAPVITNQPGYAFTGWDKTVAPATGDETYTAQFSLTNFAITYDLDGGSVATANPTTYTVESAGIRLNNPTKQGYTFDGWGKCTGRSTQNCCHHRAGFNRHKSLCRTMDSKYFYGDVG